MTRKGDYAMENFLARVQLNDFTITQTTDFLKAFASRGGTPELLDTLIKNRAYMARVVAVSKDEDVPVGYHLASLIMGPDFITPDDLGVCCKCFYSDEKKAKLLETFPYEGTLQLLHQDGCILLPSPPFAFNLRNLREHYPNLHLRGNNLKAMPAHQGAYACTDEVEPATWITIHKTAYPASPGKTWSQQQKLLGDVRIPNAPEVAFAILAYQMVRGVSLFGGSFVRTSSTIADQDGCHVSVGHFDRHGLSVVLTDDHTRNEGTGVAYSLA